MTDFEDTEEVIEGPPSLEAGETDEARYEQLERRAEPVRSYRHVPGAFNDLIRSRLEPDPAQRPSVAELANIGSLESAYLSRIFGYSEASCDECHGAC